MTLSRSGLGAARALFPLAVVILAAIYGRMPKTRATPIVSASGLLRGTVHVESVPKTIRGAGAFVSEDTYHLPAPYAGRVEEIVRLPGAAIRPGDVVVRLRNPEMEQQEADAALNLQVAEAEMANLRAQMRSQHATAISELATLRAQHRDAALKNDRDRLLHEQGLMLDLDYRLSSNAVADLAARIVLQAERDKALDESLDAQSAAKQTSLNQLRERVAAERRHLASLQVRAGVTGTIERVQVQVGQYVAAGSDLAVIVEPLRLKAALAIPEAQAIQVRVGQEAELETPHGAVHGTVARIDPYAVNSTRTVHVHLTAGGPPGIVPDQSVEGIILVGQPPGVNSVRRPVSAHENATLELFLLSPDGITADRVRVKIGRVSWNTAEVIDGAKPGDVLILNPLPEAEGFEHIRIR